ncbi:3-isopropylmalate dehydratase small subunit [Sulfitobacter mediterraneus]|uniref:3-isopropylmalate dehydratase small subunit n=1 Tax=Sulfitobacter mediterraneus TaxID=83219 RepID=UPI001933DB9C|nr:3-isopropylmalate dehydratase small subunit [Sulfitobacter mediterraneus]MBM1634340.1 3-isopropylmalate dehydratase small subunit [Sulfitobacter mediterraneus]MBM1642157.1 3-isopropylmalate dehydratase small subunit [Sulfitobacter mediterraneus]MBM1646206.1 3-isopropylmalate dehydratase small subunit [Sulfitobacter mediterraneus]MBM1650252.1 3-isopropylmalate dehydratase small subunit [Sulfitobacter mediterraneus]MBM1654274.1 3-isopropylmalate dehydratase small subunit [Sulfitobacter medite
MTPFTSVTGIAAPMPLPNIDTDVIMPKKFLKRIDREGLAQGVFHDLRFDENGNERSGFVLNRAGYRNARFIVAGRNFGCGSSREHAVWGLLQQGIRAIIAPSFAGIFFGNCEKNGLLAVELPEDKLTVLLETISDGDRAELTIDLDAQKIRPAQGAALEFDIDAGLRRNLMLGLDHIEETLQYADGIRAYEVKNGLVAEPSRGSAEA